MKFSDFTSNEDLLKNKGAAAVFDFLIEPLNINSLIIFSELGLPALSGIASTLEDKFSNDPTFPLSDFRNRQTTGRIVKFILGYFGYTPQVGGLDERAKLRTFSKAELFKTASVYSLTEKPKKRIVAEIK